MSLKKILFQDTSFRDGFQSVYGARVLTDDFLPAVEAAAAAGIDHMEAGGGARFQSLFMYCGESAFDMMDRFRAAAGHSVKLQTLARGINVVALSSQPKDMIELHARMFAGHGITHIRNFDCLNDVRNLDYSGRCIKAAGLHHQICITMMELPPGCSGAHDAQFYLARLKEILDRGIPFDSICFKDASGTSNPAKVYETIKAARALVGEDVILWHHTHDTAGLGIAQYKASIEAGADGICLARGVVSGGTSQPDLISMWHALKGTSYTLDIEISKVLEADAVFRECMKDYFTPPEALSVSSEVVLSPMPGGALTANTMMMRDTGTLHLYPKVIEAMSECVAKGGFGTSVTPLSQFYFQQAYANVTQGKWKKITAGYGNTVLGYFGKTPVKPDPEIVEIARKQLGKPVFEGDPLDILDPGIPRARAVLKDAGLEDSDENIFIVGALQTSGGNKGLDFLKGKTSVNVRKTKKTEDKASIEFKPQRVLSGREAYKVTVNGDVYDVVVEAAYGRVVSAKPAGLPEAVSNNGKGAASNGSLVSVSASLPGNVLNIAVKVGDVVKENESLVILEAMKMETPVVSPADGRVNSIEVAQGDVVQPGQVLVTLQP